MAPSGYSQAFFNDVLYNFFMKEFAERLKDLRLERELSQRGLAKLLNISHMAIQRWEKETRIPNIEELVLLAKFFDVTTDYLLGLSD